jgi:hypothetical protein
VLSEEERKERAREKSRRYRERHPDRVRESSKKYAQRNRKKIAAREAAWRSENPEYHRQWREANREKLREYERKYREENRERVQANRRRYDEKRRGDSRRKAVELVAAARNRAKKRGLAFELEIDLIHEKIVSGNCEATGLPFIVEASHPQTPSIDRVDSSGGYTLDNVRVVCFMYNQAKRDWTHDQLLNFCRAFVKNADDV